VINGVTGIRFAPQTREALIDGLTQFRNARFDDEDIRNNAAQYSEARFRENLVALLADALERQRGRRPPQRHRIHTRNDNGLKRDN
jgi:hypothetical protein